jgi:hypothetical protein
MLQCAAHEKTCYQECPWEVSSAEGQLAVGWYGVRGVCPQGNLALNLRAGDLGTRSQRLMKSSGVGDAGQRLAFAVFTGPWEV